MKVVERRRRENDGTLLWQAPTQARRGRLWFLAREGLRIAPGGGCDSHRDAPAVSARREPPRDEARRDHELVGAATGTAVRA